MAARDELNFVLLPYDSREAIGTNVAARRAGKSQRTIRKWCEEHGIGRHIAGGHWKVSVVALAMFLDGETKALSAYLAGDRDSEVVAAYFDRLGVPLRRRILK